MKVKVRDGAQLAHDGKVHEGGAVLDIPAHIAADVAHLADPVDEAGRVIHPAIDLQAELERARPHERITILEQALAKATGDVSALTEQLKKEKARVDAETKTAAKAAAPAKDPK